MASGLTSDIRREGPRRSWLCPHSVRICDRRGFPCVPFLKKCAVLSGGMTALLLTPGTGVCKPAFGVAARCQQTVAAGD